MDEGTVPPKENQRQNRLGKQQGEFRKQGAQPGKSRMRDKAQEWIKPHLMDDTKMECGLQTAKEGQGKRQQS